MSSSVEPTQLDANSTAFASDLANNYIVLISISLLTYDYFLTFIRETSLYWTTERLTWNTFMYFLNRYYTLLGSIPVMVEFFWSGSPDGSKTSAFASEPISLTVPLIGSNSRCHGLQIYHMYFATGVQLFVSTIMIMRTYALYGGSRLVLTTLLLFMVAILGLASWGAAASTGKLTAIPVIPDSQENALGCLTGLQDDSARVITAVWLGMLSLDFAVFGLTLHKALAFRRYSPKMLFTVLIRDGTIYFAVVAAANLGNILTFFFTPVRVRGAGTPFVNSISSLMISRLMLNLRDPVLTSADNSTQTGPPDLSLPSSERENTYPLSYVTEWEADD